MATSRKRYYVRPDGMHESIRIIGGKRVAFRGKSDREVDKKILEYHETAAKGRKVKEIADDWEREHEKDVKEGTRIQYAHFIRMTKDEFGILYASEVRTPALMKSVSAYGRTHSKSSTNTYCAVLRMIFRHAVQCGDIETNPAAELRSPATARPKKTRDALTAEQERAVMAWESRRKNDCVSLWYFLLFTGLRRGEALALSYSDIDRKAGVIHVTKKVSYDCGNPQIQDWLKTKNGNRDVVLFPELAHRIPKNRAGLIFPGKSGGLITQNEFYYLWKKFCREIGFVEVSETSSGKKAVRYPLTPHCFRHSFATMCYEAGIDARQAAVMLGDTAEVAEGIYTHLRAGKKEEAERQLSDFVARKMVENG